MLDQSVDSSFPVDRPSAWKAQIIIRGIADCWAFLFGLRLFLKSLKFSSTLFKCIGGNEIENCSGRLLAVLASK